MTAKKTSTSRSGKLPKSGGKKLSKSPSGSATQRVESGDFSGGPEYEANLQETIIHPDFVTDLPDPQPGIYYIRFLARSLTANSNPTFSDRLSPEEKYEARSSLLDGRKIEDVEELQELMHKWLLTFSTAFFFSLIHEQIQGIVILSDACGAAGYFNPNDRTIHINLYFHSFLVPAETHISTLLYTLIHAFLNVYSCRCTYHCAKRLKTKNGSDVIGGNGPMILNPWTAMVRAFEGEFGVNLGGKVQDALWEEMFRTEWQPKKEQFQRWGMKEVKLEEVKKIAKRRKAEGKECVLM